MRRFDNFKTVQWPDHISNGGTAVTKTSGADTAEIAATVAAFGDPKIYMKGAELHTSHKPANLSDFWAAHRARLAGLGAAGDSASDREGSEANDQSSATGRERRSNTERAGRKTMNTWQTSKMTCDACAKRWVGVHPSTAEYAECPQCHHMQPTPYAEEEGGDGQATETPRPEPRPVRWSAWLGRITLPQQCHHDGKKIPWMWNVVGWVGLESSWTLSWHPHARKCRYGLYRNLSAQCGLVACLNLPLLGDWSVWRGMGSMRPNDETQRTAL